MAEDLNHPESPMKFSGQVHPAMYAAIAQAKAERLKKEQGEKAPEVKVEAKVEKAEPKQTPKAPEKKKGTPFDQVWQSLARPQGSAQLEELVNLARGKAAIYDEVQLPSRGKFYTEEGPQDGLLHIKSMTGEEEQILITPRYAKRGQNINMIFQRCIRETFKAENLLSVDRTYLLVWLRALSFGSSYEVEIKCPDTNQKFVHTIDLSTDLLVNYCPDEFGPENLHGTMPVSEFKFNYRLSRGRDEVMVQDYKDWYVKKHGDAGDDSLTYRTALLLEDIEGLTDKQELVTLIKKLPIQDVSYLRNAVTDPPFGIDTKVTIYSPFSMNEFEIDLPLEAGFFFPKQKRKKEEAS